MKYNKQHHFSLSLSQEEVDGVVVVVVKTNCELIGVFLLDSSLTSDI